MINLIKKACGLTAASDDGYGLCEEFVAVKRTRKSVTGDYASLSIV